MDLVLSKNKNTDSSNTPTPAKCLSKNPKKLGALFQKHSSSQMETIWSGWSSILDHALGDRTFLHDQPPHWCHVTYRRELLHRLIYKQQFLFFNCHFSFSELSSETFTLSFINMHNPIHLPTKKNTRNCCFSRSPSHHPPNDHRGTVSVTSIHHNSNVSWTKTQSSIFSAAYLFSLSWNPLSSHTPSLLSTRPSAAYNLSAPQPNPPLNHHCKSPVPTMVPGTQPPPKM